MTQAVGLYDYGIDHAQYFGGHGTAYTEYEYSALGAGDTFNEALNDAMNQAWDAETPPDKREALDLINARTLPYDANELVSVSRTLEEESERTGVMLDELSEGCELYYYVGLSWNAPGA